MLKLKISSASNENLSDICTIIEEVGNSISDRNVFYIDDRNFISQHINEKGFILIAINKEKIIGFLMVRIPGLEEDNLGLDINLPEDKRNLVAHIESVAVLPEYRGNGIHKSLLLEAEDILEKRGFQYFMATVYPENGASLSNFLWAGYEIASTKQKYSGLMRHILLKEIRIK